MGKREPDLSGGFSSSLKYKRFTFNALFSFNLGNKIRLNELYTATGQALPFPQQNMSDEFVNRWQKPGEDRKSTRLNSSHANISYAVFCLKNKTPANIQIPIF